jgi:hypothetical protein
MRKLRELREVVRGGLMGGVSEMVVLWMRSLVLAKPWIDGGGHDARLCRQRRRSCGSVVGKDRSGGIGQSGTERERGVFGPYSKGTV